MLPSAFPEVQPYACVQELLEKQVDMQFQDLRALLRMPMQDQGLPGGCNLTATVLLCNIIAGASVLFWKSSVDALKPNRDRGQRFEELMAAHYPWCDLDVERNEPGARLLWRSARSPLTHALGVGKSRDLFPGAPGDEQPVALAKGGAGLPDNDTVERLLALEERPDWFQRQA